MECITQRQRDITEKYFDAHPNCNEDRVKELQKQIRIAKAQCTCMKCDSYINPTG